MKQKPLRIMHVTLTLDAGGLETMIIELHRQQTSHYTRPMVLLLQNGWTVDALLQ